MNNASMRAEYDAELARCNWNINDAREALECAVGMRDWNGVKKYASQLQEWEAKRYTCVRIYESSFPSVWEKRP
jgi:hypothetical protein